MAIQFSPFRIFGAGSFNQIRLHTSWRGRALRRLVLGVAKGDRPNRFQGPDHELAFHGKAELLPLT